MSLVLFVQLREFLLLVGRQDVVDFRIRRFVDLLDLVLEPPFSDIILAAWQVGAARMTEPLP